MCEWSLPEGFLFWNGPVALGSLESTHVSFRVAKDKGTQIAADPLSMHRDAVFEYLQNDLPILFEDFVLIPYYLSSNQ